MAVAAAAATATFDALQGDLARHLWLGAAHGEADGRSLGARDRAYRRGDRGDADNGSNASQLYVDYPKIHQCLYPGINVLLNNGAIVLTVTKADPASVTSAALFVQNDAGVREIREYVEECAKDLVKEGK